ncbi:glycoside hydrolase superfamily [Lipomyces kononenkoae]|uniref:Glycoside hydrolase superfamily n=1 Tax=Lipomyces kononenkoae TaxID=34357 RepID=A0ACC3T4A4_LIPKO
MQQLTSIDIETLLSQLTLEEKISLLAGKSTWRTAEIERLSIPNLKVSDGPSGARGQIFGEGIPAAFLPSGVSLGATWDEALLFETGKLLAEECKSKSASVILAPTMCIQRHPLGGRNFESFSEDPFLTGKLATAHIRGVQSQGIGATAKHYVANDQETDRFHVNAVIPMRAMREVYLRPFQMVVRDADPWCIMSAYNEVNGVHCDVSTELLTDIPRSEWGWNGVFMSDWGGTHDPADSLIAGLDLEMPGPPAKRTLDRMITHVQLGDISTSLIDRSVKRLLSLLQKANRFEDPHDRQEVCLDLPEQRTKLCHIARSGIVLLKNENQVLPLNPAENLTKVAILGPNAKRVVAGGGGSSYIKSPYWTSVYGSVESMFRGTKTEFVHAVGAKVNRYLRTASSAVARNPYTGKEGGLVEWFNSHDLSGDVVARTHVDDLYYITFGNIPPEIPSETGFSFRLRTILTPLTTGKHRLSLASIGPSELYINGECHTMVDGAFEKRGTLFFTYGSDESIFEYEMIAGREYHIHIDYRSHDRQLNAKLVDLMDPMEDKFQGVRLGYGEVDCSDLPQEAALVAQDCEAAIVVVGRDKEWETEGQDIPLFELPGEQVRLIEEVAKVCPRTIVVIQAGTPVQMEPWIHKVNAVLYCWYQGQELGNAAASVICGEFNPSGRLPVTFPRRLEDCPSFSSFPGENHEIVYSEGIYVGYRWWDLLGISPLFPIGYGLSYNTFEQSQHLLKNTVLLRDCPIEVTVQVRNLGGGDLPGRQTLIAWFREKSKSRLARPKKQICGFAKSSLLRPEESCTLEIAITAYDLGVYDTERRAWVIHAKSQFEMLVGPNADEIVSVGTVHAPSEITWVHRI